MFFFIGGIQPRTITLDETPRVCSACGLAQARLQRVDHYLSLFFIPLIPVKRGEPLLICDRCGFTSPPDSSFNDSAALRHACPHCGHPAEPGFKYCPQCGSRI